MIQNVSPRSSNQFRRFAAAFLISSYLKQRPALSLLMIIRERDLMTFSDVFFCAFPIFVSQIIGKNVAPTFLSESSEVISKKKLLMFYELGMTFIFFIERHTHFSQQSLNFPRALLVVEDLIDASSRFACRDPRIQ